jgi:FAD synthetase
MSRTAGIVVIGNELLSGQIRDENAVYLLDQLWGLGVDVCRLAVIPDQVDAIRDEVRAAAGAFDYVFTSGGVGPTHDDVTIPGIAAAFRLRIDRNPQLEEILHGYYQEAITEATLRMADLPEGAILVGDGGGWFPVISVQNVYVFPGVPEILRAKFESIKETFRQDPFFSERIYLRVDEGRVAHLLTEVVNRCPGVRIGSYPNLSHPAYSLRLSLDSKDREDLERARRALVRGLEQMSIALIPDCE